MAQLMRRVPPGVVLLALAPVLGELVSGHQSPAEFVNPLSFVVLSLPYGIGALACRELVVRWRRGKPSLLLLGMAYGVYEEGIVVRSFFNPNWQELGALADYGHAAGVNWTWALLLVHFHALISIGASVVLVEILYPGRRGQAWLSSKVFVTCLAGLLLWAPVGTLLSSYHPPLGWYGLSWAAVIGLGFLAHRLPTPRLPPVRHKVPDPLVFFLLGLVNMSAFFFIVFLTAESGEPPLAVTVIMLLLLDLGTLWIMLRWSQNGHGWDDRHRLALFAGLLAFFIYFSIDQDIEKWQGSSLVGLATVVALWCEWRVVVRRFRLSEPEGPTVTEAGKR
jgi:hypothetical protein